MLFRFFLPDIRLSRFDEVTPNLLASLGIKNLLTDIDNTLAPYEEPTPNDRVTAWAKAMRDAGITVALISNNNKERVDRFNETLGFPAYPNAHKPSPKRLAGIAKSLGMEIGETAALGDQIFTDVWGAKKIGARAILVPPIRDKKTLFFRFKRLLEKPILHYYEKHR